jgi:hypothetical protein
VFAISCPYLRHSYLLKQTVDDYIQTKDAGLLFYITLMGIVLYVKFFAVLLCLWANWLGQDIVKDIRIKLFKHLELQDEIF